MVTSLYLVGLSIVASILLARLFGPTGKGSYDLILATATLFASLGGLSLSSGVTYYAAQRRLALPRVLRQLAWYSAVLCLVAAGTLWIVHGTRFRDLLLPVDAGVYSFIAVVLLVPTLASVEQWRSICIGFGRIRGVNGKDLIRQSIFVILLVLVSIWGMLFGEATYSFAIWAAVGANVLGAVMLLRLLPHQRRNVGRSGFRAVVRYSVPAHASNVAQYLNYRLDFFLVSFFGGVAALGYYSIAVGLSQMLWVGSRAASRVLLPSVASDSTASGATTVLIARVGLITAACGATVFLVMGKELIVVLYGADFAPSYLPLLILLLGVVPFTLSNVLAAHLGGMGLPHLNLQGSLAGLGMTILLDLLLIPTYGIIGAAVATAASYLVTTAVIVWHFTRSCPVQMKELILPQRKDVKTVRDLLRGAASTLTGRGSNP